MMQISKKLIGLFLIAFPVFLEGQVEKLEIPLDSTSGVIIFRDVVEEEGTKNELFNRCVYWLNDFYKDPVRVTTIRDLPSGKIAGRHQFRIYYQEDGVKKAGGMVKYKFTIEFKENKYRYTINELLLKSKTNVPVEKWLNKDDPGYDPRWDGYLQQIAEYVKNWSESLKKKMKPGPEKAKDDW